MSGSDPFPELEAERAHRTFARACRDEMIRRLEAVDPDDAADEITSEFVEMTVAEALDDLRAPGAGEFFGRIDEGRDGSRPTSWYIGRRHVEDRHHDPVVVDWRAPVAAPFYRATSADPLGVELRRRFTFVDGELVGYLDEHLDDPDAADVAGGIPDPVLAEIGAARTGAMRDIVATIQGEQDVVIRSPIDRALVVQGGPGTGKTAVALHRAAYLLFEHRRRLAREGVLVVGPNRAFLDYVADVLPSLGERSVRQCTVAELCVPKVEITALDDPDVAIRKGSPEMLAALRDAATAAIAPPDDGVVVPIGARRLRVSRDEIAEWIDRAVAGTSPVNQRRERLRVLARREVLRRTGDDAAWSSMGPLKQVLDRCWPTQRPVRLVDRMLPGPRGRRRAWTLADQLLVDEASSLLDGTPFTYGHVVVDEAQDHSAVALRVIGRRAPTGSVTLVGDLAQSTAPAGQERWRDVFEHLAVGGGPLDGDVAHLSIGYRVPEPILDVANRLLPATGVDTTASRSVRAAGAPPRVVRCSPDAVGEAVAEAVASVTHRHALTGVVAPAQLHDRIDRALAEVGRRGVDHVHALGPGDTPRFDPEQVKGLEFDGVVVVEPATVLDGSARGARLLYVALTRAVQELVVVTSSELPDVLGLSA